MHSQLYMLSIYIIQALIQKALFIKTNDSADSASMLSISSHLNLEKKKKRMLYK